MKKLYNLLIIFSFLSFLGIVHAEDIEVLAQRQAGGKIIHVQVNMTLPFSYAEVWEVMNDYEYMPKFVPDINEVQLISSGKNFKQVRIKGDAQLLFLHFPIEVVMDVDYVSRTRTKLKTVQGNLGVNGTVDIHEVNGVTLVLYTADLAPSFWIPPVIGSYIFETRIKHQFEGKVAEMYRRKNIKTNLQL